MQIVIEMPEEVRTNITRMGLARIPKHQMKAVDKAIQCGTPLPKGHGVIADISKIIHTTVYNDHYEEWEEKEMPILDFVNAYTDEGITETIIEAEECEYENILYRIQ